MWVGVCVRVITAEKKVICKKMKLERAYRHFRSFEIGISKKKVSGNFSDYEEW